MGLNLSTFILEIINFLVLIWILKRFFYVPIQNTITQRKQNIQNDLAKAKQLYDDSNQLKEKYEHRLQDWEKEKDEKLAVFQQEIDALQAKETEKLKKSLEAQKQKMLVQEAQQLASTIKKNARASFQLAASFCAKFLTYFSDGHLEGKIIAKTIHDLQNIIPEEAMALSSALKDNEYKVIVESAYLIDEAQRKELIGVLELLAKNKINCVFEQNREILAGLNIRMGALFLHANLRDELTFFTKAEYEFSR